MDIVTFSPEMSELLLTYAGAWVGSCADLSTLARVDRIERFKPLLAQGDKGDSDESQILAATCQGRAVGWLFSRRRAWDSDFFGVAVTHLDLLLAPLDSAEREAVGDELLSRFFANLQSGRRYCIARVDVTDVGGVRSLERHGFGYLVPMATLGRASPKAEMRQHAGASSCEMVFGPWDRNELNAITSLARSAFTHSRFHAEPGLSSSVANELHARWAYNCCVGGLADAVFVARKDKRIVGFIAVNTQFVDKSRVGNIVLLATHPDSRRSGVGTGLLRTGIEWFANRADYCSVTTEMTNLSAMGVYGSAGYRIELEKLYLSRWL